MNKQRPAHSFQFMSNSTPKFLCDAMLGHIGRRLRAAGYDTEIDNGKIGDDVLVEMARKQDRTLLTCDRGILNLESSAQILYLPLNDELSWAEKLSNEIGLNWLLAPMTRCLDCNTPLVPADEAYQNRMPEGIRKYGRSGVVCNVCDKVYWEGTHTERMRAQLQILSEAGR